MKFTRISSQVWYVTVTLLIVHLSTSESLSWPEQLEFEIPSLMLWHPIGSCSETDSGFRKSSFTFISGSSYLKGMKAILDGNQNEAQALLQSAFFLQGNHLAPALISSSLVRKSTTEDEARSSLLMLNSELHEPAAHYFLAFAGHCRVAGNNQLALEYLELGMALLPEDKGNAVGEVLSRWVGEIYYYNGQPELAEPWLWRAAPAGYSTLILLSRILSQQGRYEEAIPLYERALSYYPQNVELVAGGARAAIAMGDMTQARGFLEKLNSPENLGIQGLLLLGRICQDMDDLPCARTYYQRVLQIDASNPDASHALQELRK